MSLYGANVEYGVHCLLHLVEQPDGTRPSSRDVADFQGVSAAFVAKIFTRLQKAGVVESVQGIAGGFQLARPANEISLLDIVDALEGRKPLFQCKEIRRNCVLHEGCPPQWAVGGVCEVHAAMLAAEARMREQLAATTLASLTRRVQQKMPRAFAQASRAWFEDRIDERTRARKTGRQAEDGGSPHERS